MVDTVNGTSFEDTAVPLAVETIGGKEFAVVKLHTGAEGVDDGPVTTANPMPVAIQGNGKYSLGKVSIPEVSASAARAREATSGAPQAAASASTATISFISISPSSSHVIRFGPQGGGHPPEHQVGAIEEDQGQGGDEDGAAHGGDYLTPPRGGRRPRSRCTSASSPKGSPGHGLRPRLGAAHAA